MMTGAGVEVIHREAGTRLDQLYPRHRVPVELERLDLDQAATCDAALVAYPHGAAAELVGELRGADLPVVDISADFRLHELSAYERTYGDHGAPGLGHGESGEVLRSIEHGAAHGALRLFPQGDRGPRGRGVAALLQVLQRVEGDFHEAHPEGL